jgi:hypothetical protein
MVFVSENDFRLYPNKFLSLLQQQADDLKAICKDLDIEFEDSYW